MCLDQSGLRQGGQALGSRPPEAETTGRAKAEGLGHRGSMLCPDRRRPPSRPASSTQSSPQPGDPSGAHPRPRPAEEERKVSPAAASGSPGPAAGASAAT